MPISPYEVWPCGPAKGSREPTPRGWAPEGRDRRALRVERGQDLLDGPVLAGGVDTLQDDEYRPFGLRPETILQVGQALELSRRLILGRGFVPARGCHRDRASRVGRACRLDPEGPSKVGHRRMVARPPHRDGGCHRADAARFHAQGASMTVATGTRPIPSSSPAAGPGSRTCSTSPTRQTRATPRIDVSRDAEQYEEAVGAAVEAFKVTRVLPAYERGRMPVDLGRREGPPRGAWAADRPRGRQADA